MKQVARIGVSTVVLAGLFAMAQGRGAAAERPRLGAADDAAAAAKGDGPSVEACNWGTVVCPDPAGFELTYTTSRPCLSICFQAQFSSQAQALTACNNACSAACFDSGVLDICG
jgi:hypothetical protein